MTVQPSSSPACGARRGGSAVTTTWALAALMLACPSGQAQPAPAPGTVTRSSALAGDWVGGYRIGKRHTLFALHLSTGAPASFDLPLADVSARPLGDFLATGEGIRFSLPGPRGTTVALQGHVEGGSRRDALVGVARSGGEEGSFELQRTLILPPTTTRAYAGLYHAGEGHYFAVEPLPDAPLLHFTDFSTGRFGAIFPVAPLGPAAEDVPRNAPPPNNTFFAGPALLVPAPPVLRLEFRVDPARPGEVVDVTFQQDGEPDVIAERVPLRETPLEISSGALRLAATLVAPAGPGPHPAVVLTPNASDRPRDAYRKDADFFAAHGFAALIYDKRGVGDPTGDWRGATISELASDTLAAVELLRTRAEIDPLRIGVWGESQGGWVAALAASRAPAIAFLINISTSATTPAEQELYRIEHSLRADGFPEAQILDAVSYQRTYMDWIREGLGRETLIAAAKAAKAAPWASHVALPPEPLPIRIAGTTREFYTYDPVPALRLLRCPALFVFGAVDSVVPVVKSVPTIESAISRHRDPDSQIKVLPRTAHGMWETDIDSHDAYPQAHRHGPGYWPLLARWLGDVRTRPVK